METTSYLKSSTASHLWSESNRIEYVGSPNKVLKPNIIKRIEPTPIA